MLHGKNHPNDESTNPVSYLINPLRIKNNQTTFSESMLGCLGIEAKLTNKGRGFVPEHVLR